MNALAVIPLPAEIWWVDFGHGLPGEPAGMRPVVLMAPSADLVRDTPVVTVIPITRTRRAYPFRMEITPTQENGLNEESFAQVDLVRSVSKDRLTHLSGHLDSQTWNMLQAMLWELFDV